MAIAEPGPAEDFNPDGPTKDTLEPMDSRHRVRGSGGAVSACTKDTKRDIVEATENVTVTLPTNHHDICFILGALPQFEILHLIWVLPRSFYRVAILQICKMLK